MSLWLKLASQSHSFASTLARTLYHQSNIRRSIAHCGQTVNYYIIVYMFNALFSAPFSPRTHTCGALTPSDVNSQVVLAGWLLPGR